LERLNEELKKNDKVEEVFYQKDIIDNLNYWLDIIRIFAIGIFACLGLLSLLILIIVISMKVISKKTNIGIMKNIGASNFYIRSPYLWEGIFYGLFGSIFAWVASYSLIILNKDIITEFFNTIKIFPIDYQFLTFQIAIGLGVSCFLGLVASFWAVSRMLKKTT
jgi:cell division transport system permease protein